MKLIGNRSEMGLEIQLFPNEPNRGNARIWLGGKFISTLYDDIYIRSYLFNLLDEIRNARPLDPFFEKEWKSNEGIFSMLERSLTTDSMNSQKYLVRGSTFTDCFRIFFFKVNDSIHVLWKRRLDYDFPDVVSQGDDIFHYVVDKMSFDNWFSIVKAELS